MASLNREMRKETPLKHEVKTRESTFSAIFRLSEKALFARVRSLRPVLRLWRNYFHDLSMVNSLSYRRLLMPKSKLYGLKLSFCFLQSRFPCGWTMRWELCKVSINFSLFLEWNKRFHLSRWFCLWFSCLCCNFWNTKAYFKHANLVWKLFHAILDWKFDIARNPLFSGIFVLEIDWWKG